VGAVLFLKALSDLWQDRERESDGSDYGSGDARVESIPARRITGGLKLLLFLPV
jgi:hypothetical protein